MEVAMEKRWCSACGEPFDPRPQSPRQAYCSRPTCQQARKRLWQCTKRRTDDDYRGNQALAQEAWRRSHPDYWRQYRDAHPEYASQNRLKQRRRNATHRAGGVVLIAKEDASPPGLPLAGTFLLTQLQPGYPGAPRIWTVQLAVLSAS